jgi:cell division septation protein DedD
MSESIDASSHTQAMATVLDQSQESHIDQLHRAAIGPVNTDYYLPILARFEAYDRGSPSWNWAASLCTLNWMAFRGLWRPALAYLATLVGAALGLMALTHFATGMAESIRWGLWSALATLALLVPGFFGNIWLFNNHRKRLVQALAATPTLRDACLQLSRQASSRQRMLGLAMANGTLAITLASAWFWYPGNTLRDRASGERSGAVVGATVAPGPASQATGLASTPAAPAPSPTPASTHTSAPSTDPQAAASAASQPLAPASAPTSAPTSAPASAVSPQALAPAASAAAAPVPLTRPAEAASATVSATPMAAATQQAPPLATPPRLSQAATRHAAIASRSRKAHTQAAAPAPALAPAPAARPEAAPGAPARATPPPKRALAASTGTTPAAPASRATAEGRFQINVGLFAQRDNAQRAVERLQGAGLPVTTQDLARASGTLTRVRVGPFATREQADAAARQIRTLQLDAVVVRP